MKFLLTMCLVALVLVLALPQQSFAAVPPSSGSPLSVATIASSDSDALAEPDKPVKLKQVADGAYRLKVSSDTGVTLADPKGSDAAGAQMKSAKTSAKAESQKFYVRNEGDGLVSLQVVSSGLFLGDENGSVVQKKDGDDVSMRWRLVSDGGVKIENAGTGAALTLAGGKAVKGARAITAADEKGAVLRWNLSPAKLIADGYYRIKSAVGKYLDVNKAACTVGANLQTWIRSSSGAQAFHIYEKSHGYYYIENSKSFLMVGVPKAGSSSHANAVQSKKSGKDHTLWKPIFDRSGKVMFKNKKSGKVLEVANSSKNRGANVRQNNLTHAKGQLWKLEKTERYSLTGNGNLDKCVATALRTLKDLRSAFYWTVHHPYREGQRYYSNPHVLPDSRTAALASDFFAHGSGNCYRFACTFSWLARGLGYKTKVISGWVAAAGGGRAPHGWVEVSNGGRTYVCDPDLQHEMPAYNWFMTTYMTSPTAYHSW